MKKFYTKYDIPEFTGNRNSRVQEEGMDTQQYGYQTVEKQVSRLLMSGARLSDFRQKVGTYTFKDGIDDGRPVDPTCTGSNYDLSDATRDIEYLMSVAEVKKEEKKVNIDETNVVGKN